LVSDKAVTIGRESQEASSRETKVQAAGGRDDIRYKARRAANVMTDSSSSSSFDTKRGGGGGSDTGRAVGRSKESAESSPGSWKQQASD
jgi:hypothetical protein